eukprot:COSAG02_NODE_40814_length_401_cov_0.847682_1_plen_112_part_10
MHTTSHRYSAALQLLLLLLLQLLLDGSLVEAWLAGSRIAVWVAESWLFAPPLTDVCRLAMEQPSALPSSAGAQTRRGSREAIAPVPGQSGPSWSDLQKVLDRVTALERVEEE